MMTAVELKARPGGACSRHPDRVAVGLIHGTRHAPYRGDVNTTRHACQQCMDRAEATINARNRDAAQP